jgi:hypothetical protein
MKTLPESIQQQFQECWVVSKTANKFSSMPIDQAHEQNNALLKGPGGIIGLTENPVSFRRWLVAGPEIVRCMEEFEDRSLVKKGQAKTQHHDQGLSTQKNFQSNVKNLVNTMTEWGNPFLVDCPELIALDTHNCAHESVVVTVNTIEEVGRIQYDAYVKNVIKDKTAAVSDTISKNSLAFFKRQEPKKISKSSLKLSALSSDRYLFSRLY